MEVESEPDIECTEFVEVLGTAVTGDNESFDGVGSGREGSTDFDFDK